MIPWNLALNNKFAASEFDIFVLFQYCNSYDLKYVQFNSVSSRSYLICNAKSVIA